jgi:hypothetical protein
VEDQRTTPPATPADGQAWLIGTGATGAWAGHDGTIAMRQAGQWLFATARDGIHLLNRSSGQWMSRIAGTWHAPAAPTAPSGGSVVDTEARSALAALVTALRTAGVLPA